jgi:hypothetical protein
MYKFEIKAWKGWFNRKGITRKIQAKDMANAVITFIKQNPEYASHIKCTYISSI